ncbi:MAG: hypothetical protein ACREPM_22100, partial [Gemmatimonadaceae bacterium]
MLHQLVRVLMLVPLADVEPDACRHARAPEHERHGDRIAPQDERQRRTDEWCGGEVGAGTR